MEIRKIQFTGKASYIITLPKQWIKDSKVKKGDQVKIIRTGKILQVQPYNSNVQEEKKIAVFEIDSEDKPETVIRKLISCYFLGFKTIQIKPKSRMKPNQRTAVKNAVRHRLMGAEIVSESIEGMTIQIMLNQVELSVDGALKRMVHLIKSMLSDAILALREENYELAEEVISTDDEVDRFGFHIIRQLEIIIQNENIRQEIGLHDIRDCLGYRLIVKSVERTGDHIITLAEDLLEFKKKIKNDVIDLLEVMAKVVISKLDDSCLALYKGDYTLAEKTISGASEILKFDKKLGDYTRKTQDDETVYRIRRMSESIKRISEYANDISEIVLNMNVQKILKQPR